MLGWRRNECPPAITLDTAPGPTRPRRIGVVPVGMTVWITANSIYRDRKGRHYFWDYLSSVSMTPGFYRIKAERLPCGWRVWLNEPLDRSDISGRSLIWRDYTPIIEVVTGG